MKQVVHFCTCLLVLLLYFHLPSYSQRVAGTSQKPSLVVDFFQNGFYKTAISKELEPDSAARRMLTRYINTFLDGTRKPLSPANMAFIISRPSFKTCLLLIYSPKPTPAFSFRGTPENRAELGKGYLFGLRNCCIDTLFSLADTLLAQQEFDGVLVLWEKADVQRLSYFQRYVASIPADGFFQYADLAAIMHNAHAYKLRDQFLARCKKIQDFQDNYNALLKLIETQPRFAEVDYKEAVYGSGY